MIKNRIDIVFLDVDGVLTDLDSKPVRKYLYGKQVNFRRSSVSLIHELQHYTGCRFVVSSSWRANLSISELEMAFMERGLCIRILDTTPLLGVERGQEIDLWLQTNDWDRYIVIDDSVKDISEWCDNIIKVDPTVGFNEKNFQHSLIYIT